MLGKNEYLELRSEYINSLLDDIRENLYDKESHIIDNDYLDRLRSGLRKIKDDLEGIYGWLRMHETDIPIDTFLILQTYIQAMESSIEVQINDTNNFQNIAAKIYSEKDSIPMEETVDRLNRTREQLYGLIIGFINQFSSLVAHFLDKLKSDNIEHRNISEKMFDQIFPFGLIGRIVNK